MGIINVGDRVRIGRGKVEWTVTGIEEGITQVVSDKGAVRSVKTDLLTFCWGFSATPEQREMLLQLDAQKSEPVGVATRNYRIRQATREAFKGLPFKIESNSAGYHMDNPPVVYLP